jgi:hypothetical protein
MWGYRSQSKDTSEVADRIQFDLIRGMDDRRRADLLNSILIAGEQLACCGIRLRHPKATLREIVLRRAALHIDRKTMIEVFDWDPLEKGY